jgi:hypothetical protein
LAQGVELSDALLLLFVQFVQDVRPYRFTFLGQLSNSSVPAC